MGATWPECWKCGSSTCTGGCKEPIEELGIAEDAPRVCIAVYDSAQLAEEKRIALLNTGVRLAWADDFKIDIAGGYCLHVRPEDARGAYVRLKDMEHD